MLKAVADIKDDVVKFTREIVRIQSYTGKEKEMAECLLGKLQEFDLDDAFIDGIGNVVGLIRGEATGPNVMLNGHLDIVPAGNLANWEGRSLPSHGRSVFGECSDGCTSHATDGHFRHSTDPMLLGHFL